MRGMLGRAPIVLINPNTDERVTAAMVKIARETSPGIFIEGLTAPFGERLITNPAALQVAAAAVAAACETIAASSPSGVIVSAFGDPGLAAARARLAVPVVGIAEASMLTAAAIGRFCVVTTTPELVASITDCASRFGVADKFCGVELTQGDPAELMANPARLFDALLDACRVAVTRHPIAAIIIGGGPLATAAQALRSQVNVPIVEPIPCAVDRMIELIARTR